MRAGRFAEADAVEGAPAERFLSFFSATATLLATSSASFPSEFWSCRRVGSLAASFNARVFSSRGRHPGAVPPRIVKVLAGSVRSAGRRLRGPSSKELRRGASYPVARGPCSQSSPAARLLCVGCNHTLGIREEQIFAFLARARVAALCYRWPARTTAARTALQRRRQLLKNEIECFGDFVALLDFIGVIGAHRALVHSWPQIPMSISCRYHMSSPHLSKLCRHNSARFPGICDAPQVSP